MKSWEWLTPQDLSFDVHRNVFIFVFVSIQKAISITPPTPNSACTPKKNVNGPFTYLILFHETSAQNNKKSPLSASITFRSTVTTKTKLNWNLKATKFSSRLFFFVYKNVWQIFILLLFRCSPRAKANHFFFFFLCSTINITCTHWTYTAIVHF